jgi:uncharacterized protein YjdB
MDRRLSSGVTTALAMIGIFSCSDGPTGINNFNSDDLSADASRVSTVTVSFSTTSIAVGDTTRAAAVLKDYRGQVLDRSVTWSSSNSAVAAVDTTGLVTGIAPGSAVIAAVRGYKSGSASIAVVPAGSPQPTKPGTVTDLKVTAADSNSVTLSFTQVNNGTGQPAQYDVRYATPPIAWGSAPSATSGTCTTPIAGTAIGTPLVCKVLGLQRSSKYDFQLIAFRGTLNLNAVFGSLSNIVSATTTGSAPPPPAPVASVSVSPATATIQTGGTVQLSATTRDASGNVLIGRTISWSSANSGIASVNQSTGLVAAVAVGTVQITATSEGKTGSATLTVASSPPPPPPPPGSVEPPGMTTLSERAFNSVAEDGWGVSAWSGSVSNCTIESDAIAPMSPPNIGRIRYPAGFASGGEPCGESKPLSGNYRTMYLSFWFKVSPNWVGHQTGANKIFHITIGGSNHFVVNLWGYGNGILQMGVLLQGIVNSGTGSTAANWLPNLGTGEVVRGKWYHVEMIAVGNSSGAADGSVDWWLNGTKIGSHSGIQYVSGAGTWQNIAWAPTWGGAGPAVPAEMYQYIDHLRLSAK